LRKGRSYGAILVDLEKHAEVDVLADCSAESLSRWLKEHPGVEIISRDRGTEFIEGASPATSPNPIMSQRVNRTFIILLP
jgi:transposase